MRGMLRSGESDGWDILRQPSLGLHSRLCSVQKDMAHKLLHMSREATGDRVSNDGDGREAGNPWYKQAEREERINHGIAHLVKFLFSVNAVGLRYWKEGHQSHGITL